MRKWFMGLPTWKKPSKTNLGMVEHACGPRYVAGKCRKNHGLRPALSKNKSLSEKITKIERAEAG
jgi:hypothetical protein